MKRVVVAVVSTLAVAVSGAGVARATIDLADFQAALDALFAVDPELAVHAQANSSGGNDFAVGGGQSSVGSNFGLSAHRRAGEDPWGHLSDTIPDDGKIRARIICLQVVTSGGVKTAGMIGEITESSSNTAPAGFFIRVFVRDTGLPGGEGDGYRRTFTSRRPEPPFVCPPTAMIFDIVHGNININDAP